MKYFTQFAVILAVSFLGEVLHALIPLPIPASIYGLVLMLAALITGVIPLHRVKEAGKFLVDIMPLMFIPAAVGLLDSWDTLRSILVPVAVIVVVTTVLVMAVSGRVTQAIMRRGKTGNRFSETSVSSTEREKRTEENIENRFSEISADKGVRENISEKGGVAK